MTKTSIPADATSCKRKKALVPAPHPAPGLQAKGEDQGLQGQRIHEDPPRAIPTGMTRV